MPSVVHTKEFNKLLRNLLKKGKKGKDAMMKARAAQSEAATEGEIKFLKRTNYGESRLANIEKYDLGDAYRLVVQLVDASKGQRAFLFVGDHEDADRWLENHKNYKWVKRDSDSTLKFVQVSDPKEPVSLVSDADIESPESLLELSLLRDVTDEQWATTEFTSEAIEYIRTISAIDWEGDPNGIVSHVVALSNEEIACFAIDILDHAHRREFEEMHRRFEIAEGTSEVVEEADAAEAMVSTENSENFVTWEDSADLPPEADWADWMLFLHPEQKKYAVRDFKGPARLRGVSGSGKTCVMVHRARRLAKEYKQTILLVTLTESMRRLLDILVRDLCGTESAYIVTSTMNAIATDAVHALDERGTAYFTMANRNQIADIKQAAIRKVRNHTDFESTLLSKMSSNFFDQFIEDEIAFVRQRYLPEKYEEYLNTKRYGRGIPLGQKARTIILSAVAYWDDSLAAIYLKDYDGIVQTSLECLSKSIYAPRGTFSYRCVLVDEVQDLSQLEMRILSLIPDNNGKRAVDLPNGLFLVGDGAQTIYKKGFALTHCGVTIGNRSFVLQKNYRNTREILEAAYGLISNYEFADVDEENITSPTEPHMSSRHGEKPIVVKCKTEQEESAFVVNRIREIIEEQRLIDEANELVGRTEIPIAVIGFNRNDRDRIERELKKENIPTTRLREDVGWDNNAVKISTLESAKGHEFYAVFIVGVNQGTIPNFRVPEDDWKREAARLYVAMTRARDLLYMSYNVASRNGPSIILASIQSDCHESEYEAGRLVSSE